MKVITIGRSSGNNDIIVDDVNVSRNHLQIIQDDNGNYSVVDLDSTNGTKVNGVRITEETRLQPDDQILIGTTILPWQSYFTATQPQEVPSTTSQLRVDPPKPNRWLYVLVGAIVLLVIGGVVGWKVYDNKKKEKARQEQELKKKESEEAKRKDAEEARMEAVKASEEYEKAMRRAAETQSDEDRANAEKMKLKAKEAEERAQQKEDDWNRMKTDLDAANKAKDDAVEQSERDKKARDDALKEAKEAQKAAEEAEKAKRKVEKEVELTKRFYRQIAEVRPKITIFDKDYYQKICDKMGLKPSSNENKKDLIIDEFEKADEAGKKKIINAVEEVLKIQENEMPEVKPVDGNKGEIEAVPTTPPMDSIEKEE